MSARGDAPAALELYGDEALRSTQMRLFAARHELGSIPGSFLQGRTWGLLHVAPAEIAARLGAAGVADRLLVHGDRRDLPAIATELEARGFMTSPPLLVLGGTADGLTAACEGVRRRCRLAPGWAWAELDGSTSGALVRSIQELHERCGVTPLPGWFMRGRGAPALTLALLGGDGRLVAAGTAHPIAGRGSLARAIMGAALCVHPDQRGRGLGRLLNAELLLRGLEAYQASTAIEVLEDPDGPSRRMNVACGLRPDVTGGFIFAAWKRRSAAAPASNQPSQGGDPSWSYESL